MFRHAMKQAFGRDADGGEFNLQVIRLLWDRNIDPHTARVYHEADGCVRVESRDGASLKIVRNRGHQQVRAHSYQAPKALPPIDRGFNV